jgi:hypothetical protein
MWADPYDLAGMDLGEPATAEQIQALNANYSPEQVAQILASNAGSSSVAVNPTTETQIFNLIGTVAKGLLDIQQVGAQTKMSTAQAAAAAEASKVMAQNYVMQQLQSGKSVLLPESWLQKYSASGTATKWLTPVLIIGGIALLGYAAYKYSQKRKGVSAVETPSQKTFSYTAPTTSLSEGDALMAAANPRRRRRRKSRR